MKSSVASDIVCIFWDCEVVCCLARARCTCLYGKVITSANRCGSRRAGGHDGSGAYYLYVSSNATWLGPIQFIATMHPCRGLGVVASYRPSSLSARHGRLRERARFRRLLSKSRDDGAGTDPMHIAGKGRGDAFLACLGLTVGLEETHDVALSSNSWTVVVSQPWKQPPSHITLMEAKTCSFTARHIARSFANPDNMSTVCMGGKGRAADSPLLQ